MFVRLPSGKELCIGVFHDRKDLLGVTPSKHGSAYNLSTIPKTLVWLNYTHNPDMRVYGEAYCVPTDHYNKKKGTRMALARAMREMGLGREDRVEVWKSFGLGTPKNKRREGKV